MSTRAEVFGVGFRIQRYYSMLLTQTMPTLLRELPGWSHVGLNMRVLVLDCSVMVR